MNIKPILFNTDMVKAILEGRKTQTRRVCKGQGKCNPVQIGYHPPFKPGDFLYVREAWCDPNPENPFAPLAYKADFPMHWDANLTEHGEPVTITAEEMKWRPSIHMPKEAARIFLKVKDIRVERLRDMNDSDLAKEGFGDWIRFISLWNSTIKSTDCGEHDWNANPWVWVIEFERCEKPEGWY